MALGDRTTEVANSVACPCCPAGDCAMVAACPSWSSGSGYLGPASVRFTIDGVTDTGVPCCDLYDVFGFGSTAEARPVPECVNREFFILFGPAGPGFCFFFGFGGCHAIITFTNDSGTGATTQYFIIAQLGISSSFTDNGITLYLTINGFPDVGFGISGSQPCSFSVTYEGAYTSDDFPCAGPWVLDLVTSSGVLENWPAILEVTPDDVPPESPSPICCDIIATSCVPASWFCVDGDCIDPRDGTGTYSTLADCLAACDVAESYNCVGGTCTDPGDGSGTYTGPTAAADCAAACTPGGGDTRPLCCPDYDLPDQLTVDISGDCFHPNPSPQIAVWDIGDGSYTVSFFYGGHSFRVRIYCVPDGAGGGQWYVELRCIETVIAAAPLDEGNGSASAVVGVGSDCCALSDVITFRLTPVAGGNALCS